MGLSFGELLELHRSSLHVFCFVTFEGVSLMRFVVLTLVCVLGMACLNTADAGVLFNRGCTACAPAACTPAVDVPEVCTPAVDVPEVCTPAVAGEVVVKRVLFNGRLRNVVKKVLQWRPLKRVRARRVARHADCN